ncbi:MAG: serine/threonine protein kinase [Planctomycetales bacterium]|nr:serine/threonine protein kinase [Planctomycetales bacterium]
MNESKHDLRLEDTTSIPAELLEHFDQLLTCLLDNDRAGAERLLESHPEHAEKLRQVMPAMEIMACLKEIDASSLLGAPSGEQIPAAVQPIDEAVLGDFRLVREIGRGGMGIVYEAIQLSLQRRVAVKVLPLAGMIDPRAMARFQNEARAAATLFHAHIVPVLFVGVERGVHFYAMNLIAGQSLAAIITATHRSPSSPDDTPKPNEPVTPGQLETQPIAAASTLRVDLPREFARHVAEIGSQIASGLHFAHEHGIVHRDVKPGNILLDDQGKAWVTDFGLARLESDPGGTATGDVLGTLRYMSPEQVSGRTAAVDQRTDIYALGATLFELATGQPLFPGRDRHQLTQAILNDAPPAPRTLQPSLPRDLETIILKAVEKERQDRYATADAMAEDLRRFCRDESIQARRPSALSLIAKWTRRHGTMLQAIVVTLLFCATVGALFVARAWRRERQQRVIAEDHLALARTAVDKMYTNVAANWLADEPALSTLQQRFLRDGLSIYERLAESSSDDPSQRSHAAIAHRRIAQIQSALGNDTAAARSLDRSITILESLLTDDPADAATIIGQLISYNQSVALTYLQIGDLENARRAADRNEPHLNVLRSSGSSDNGRKRSDLHQQYVQAAVHAGLEDYEVAEELIRQAVAGMAKLQRDYRNDFEFALQRLNYSYLLGAILRERSELEESRQVCERTLRTCQHRAGQYDDSRELHELIAAVHVELAEISVADGKLDEAATHLEQSLSEQRRYLTDNAGPAIRYYEGFMENRSNGGSERQRYVDYVRVQIRLAEILQQMGRLHESEGVLSEVYFASYIMGGAYRSKKSFEPRVLFVHGCALLASVLESRGSDDAALVRDVAAATWNMLQKDLTTPFHDAVDAMKQLKRSEQSIKILNSSKTTGDVRAATSALQTSRCRTRIGGHVCFAAQRWDEAVACFQDILNSPEEATAYDALHLALALHELNRADDACNAYVRATTMLNAEMPPDVADLHFRVGQLLELSPHGETPTPED